MMLGSNPIENVRSAGSVTGRVCRATRVPVSTLMSAAMATADVPTVVLAGGRMVPPTTAPGLANGVRTMFTPWVGPPVMTGSPTAFCQVFDPSTIEAKSA
jgi:hypothetical protein